MSRTRRQYLFILALILFAAFVLRLYRLDAVPLRGDEAFAVRYWAASPSETVSDLAGEEPHPFGTFFSFWAWKTIAGDSEFAMRYLPLLGNLIGVAAVVALGKRLFHADRAAYLAAALWAINPFLIWHAQDVRNYAIWASLSPLAMWLFLRAAASNCPRDWAFYITAEALALYIFFLEAFMLPVQALYLLRHRRTFVIRSRRALVAWIILAVLLVPWFIQLWWLSGSNYTGTLGAAKPAQLITWFLPALLTGDAFAAPWDWIVPLVWFVLIALLLRRQQTPNLPWLVAWIVLPAVFLSLAATRMNVFHPRYLIAITPALLLLTARALFPFSETFRSPLPPRRLERGPGGEVKGAAAAARLALLIIPLLGLFTLAAYYRGDDPKSPDWPALTTYLERRTKPDDLIVQALADPAFSYYYDGEADEGSLKYGEDASDQLIKAITKYETIWLVGRSADAEAFLRDYLQEISVDGFSSFTVSQYRQWEVSPDEFTTPADVTFGEIARLKGYTIQGPDSSTRAVTILLYWEPLAQAEIDYSVFVHLIGSPHPNTGNPLWDQDDHRPLYGFASTISWPIGDLIRDPYHILDDPAVTLSPGAYTIRIGFYDPATNERLPVMDSKGNPLGDNYTLATLNWPK